MLHGKQLSLFPNLADILEPTASPASQDNRTVILPKKTRQYSIEANLDELTAKKLYASWQKQLKRFDKYAQVRMETTHQKRSWHNMPFLVIDTETTGLNHQTNRVIEIAWVLFDNEKIIEERSCLCSIDSDIPTEITSLTGITNEMLKGKPAFENHIDDLLEDLGKAVFVVAYNASFDKQFVESEFKRAKRKLPNLPWVDPCTFVREIDKYQKGKKLTDAARRWGIELNGAHRALADATAAGLLLYKLAPYIKISDLEDLLAQQTIWRAQQEKNFQDYMARKKSESNLSLF